jgi:hypothetical protein
VRSLYALPANKRLLISFKSQHFFSMPRQPLGGQGRLNFRGFKITLFKHITLGRSPLDEDVYLTTHNTHKRQTSMPPAGFFFVCPGFSPFDPFLYCLNPFCPSCHFTFHATVLITNTTQTSMPPVGFEPTIQVSERPQTHALDCAATGIGLNVH